MSSEQTYGGPSGANNSTIEYAENALINNVAGKKVFNVGSDGNIVEPATSTAQTDGSQVTKIKETVPTDSTKLNSSLVVSYNANGDCVRVVKTIGATNYTKNITPENGDTVIVTSKSISVWS